MWWIGATALFLILCIVIATLAVSRYAFRQVTMWERSTLDKAFETVEGFGLMSRQEFDAIHKEDVSINSADGLVLRGYYIEPYPDRKKVVIIVHGYTANHIIGSQFIRLFIDEGYNVLLVDQRSHGRSEGTYATYGYYEREDLDRWVEWVRERVGSDVYIGLHGQSMGGGTVLMYAGINKHAKFIIADCPYSDMEDLMKYQMKELNRVPHFPFIALLERRLNRLAKFSMKRVKPIQEVADKPIPLLLIHGGKDTFVPTRMSEQIYREKSVGMTKLVIIDNAVHANAYPTARQQYEAAVHDFLQAVYKHNGEGGNKTWGNNAANGA
ncbi:alpha/beta hydrolase [Paenibacillus sp. B1-33]|uniref:alpha/beta hydrolase n=1 Tax=unclassified Paenibacillus TaxID=185978 RepID=UPI003D2E8E66